MVVDLSPENHLGQGAHSTFEWAIRIAASVCQQLHAHHARVEVVCIGLPKGVPARASNRLGIRPLLDFLALLPQFVPVESKHQIGERDDFPFENQHQFTILIHTKSFRAVPAGDRTRHICIDPSGFVDDEFESELVTNSKVVPSDSGPAITSPQTAPEELNTLWTGGSHAFR